MNNNVTTRELLIKHANEKLKKQLESRGVDPDSDIASLFLLDGNYSGSTGEELMKDECRIVGGEVKNPNVTHTDYDILLGCLNNEVKKLEVKTARVDSHGCYQFDGIRTKDDFDYIFLLAIDASGMIFFNFLPKSSLFEANFRGEPRWHICFNSLAPKECTKVLSKMDRSASDGGGKVTLSQKVLQKYGFLNYDTFGRSWLTSIVNGTYNEETLRLALPV